MSHQTDDERLSSGKGWKGNLLLFVITLLFCALLLEVGGRVAMRMRRQALFQSASLGNVINAYHPDYMWMMKENLNQIETSEVSGVPWSVTTNELGLRHGPIREKNGVTRILTLGDSTTFGVGVSDGDTYPVQLQKMLDESFPDRFEVINAGVSGFSSYQGLLLLKKLGLVLQPDIVIACFGHNEGSRVEENGLRDLAWENPESGSGFLNLSRLVIRGLCNRSPFGNATERMTPGEMLDCLHAMRRFCGEHNAVLVQVVWPYVEELRRGSQVSYTTVHIEATRGNIPAINLFDALRGVGEACYFDSVHVNAEGNRLVARYVLDKLMEILPMYFLGH